MSGRMKDPLPMVDSVAVLRKHVKPVSRRHRRMVRRTLAPYLFLAPFLVLFAGVLVLPLLMAFDLSLFRDTLARGTIFVGLQNYVDILSDVALWEGLRHVMEFGAVQIPIMLCLALILALVLDSGLVWGRNLFRIAFFLPYAVPSVIGALIWAYIYGPAFGLFAPIGHFLHMAMPNFLAPQMMLSSLGNVVTWEYTGYNMIVLYAALQAVPRDVVEASWVCGAKPWQTALRHPHSADQPGHHAHRHLFDHRHAAALQ